jgi:hypothetical protein
MADKKIIAVVGATGSHGGGLCRAILADTNEGFAVRAILRAPTQDQAKTPTANGTQVNKPTGKILWFEGPVAERFAGAAANADRSQHKRLRGFSSKSSKGRVDDLDIQRGLMGKYAGDLAPKIFISYSHEDRGWLEELKTTLKTFVRNSQLELWDDSRIQAGAPWQTEIEQALKGSDAAILLVSRRYLASDFILDQELLPILRAAKHRGLHVLWIAVSATMYEDSDLNEFQALNDPERYGSKTRTC